MYTGTFTLPRTFKCTNSARAESKKKKDTVWMIPILFQSDLKQVHLKAGFTDQGEWSQRQRCVALCMTANGCPRADCPILSYAGPQSNNPFLQFNTVFGKGWYRIVSKTWFQNIPDCLFYSNNLSLLVWETSTQVSASTSYVKSEAKQILGSTLIFFTDPGGSRGKCNWK